jgi:class 3 adenylate cyclase
MSDDGLVRRLAAILAADIAGYSRLMNEDEDATIRSWRRAREEVADPRIAEFGGRIVKHTGDGFLAVFDTVVDAVRCALAMQPGFGELNKPLPSKRRLFFRMGINLGDIVVERDDIQGDGVNIAARLEGLAEPGGICLSGDVYRQVKNKLHVSYRELGEKHVKNIAEPIVAYLIPPADGFAVPPSLKIDDEVETPRPRPASESESVPGDASDKRRLTAFAMWLLLGTFGGHRYYLGRKATGFLQTFTIGGLALWWLADGVLLVTGELKDGEGKKLVRWI